MDMNVIKCTPGDPWGTAVLDIVPTRLVWLAIQTILIAQSGWSSKPDSH